MFFFIYIRFWFDITNLSFPPPGSLRVSKQPLSSPLPRASSILSTRRHVEWIQNVFNGILSRKVESYTFVRQFWSSFQETFYFILQDFKGKLFVYSFTFIEWLFCRLWFYISTWDKCFCWVEIMYLQDILLSPKQSLINFLDESIWRQENPQN